MPAKSRGALAVCRRSQSARIFRACSGGSLLVAPRSRSRCRPGCLKERIPMGPGYHNRANPNLAKSREIIRLGAMTDFSRRRLARGKDGKSFRTSPSTLPTRPLRDVTARMADLGLLGERAPRPEFPAGSWARATVCSRMARPAGGAGLSRGLGSVANPAAAAAGAQGALSGAQTRIAAAELPGIGAARPARDRRPVYPQLCGAGHAEDEGAPENFVPVPVRAGGAGLRHVAQCASECAAQGRNRVEAVLPGPEILFAALPP